METHHLVDRVCYACPSKSSTFYASENGFDLVKCSGCGLLFVQNRPSDDEVTAAHTQGSHRGEEALEVTGTYRQSKVGLYERALTELFPEGFDSYSTWLDIGTGHGELLVALRNLTNDRITAVGSEPNEHKRTAARSRGLNLEFFDLADHNGRYDVISLMNVWSHIPDPPAFVASLVRLLEPDGQLILRTGDTADLPAKQHHRPFQLPDHLSFASESIIRDVLSEQSFEVTEVAKYPLVSLSGRELIRQVGRAVLPGRSSMLRYVDSRKYTVDMFVRARLVQRK